MNWSDERYVRVYVRDTVEWLAWSWQAQALFLLLLRKVDRAGCLDLPADKAKAARGLSRMVGMPEDVIAECLPELEESGAIVAGERGLMVRNYVAAQESVASNAERQRRYKDRQAAVTERHDASPVGIESHQEVTRANAESRAVTPSVPSLAVPSLAEPKDRPVEPPQLELVASEPTVDVAAVHDAAYAAYPASRRTGKAKGLEALRASVRTPDDAERFARVVAAHLASASEDKFVRHWERICSTWTHMPDVAPARASPDPRRGSVRPLAAHEYPVGDQEI